jgi:hypothetical protein
MLVGEEDKMKELEGWTLGILLSFVSALMYAIFVALPVMVLWNLLLPGLFAFKHISLIDAVELSLLTRFLIGTITNSIIK